MHPKFMSLVDVADKADACTDDTTCTTGTLKKCSVPTGICYDPDAKVNEACVALKADGMTLSLGGECLADCKNTDTTTGVTSVPGFH